MKNNYSVILYAGGRLNGVQKFGSEAERLHHEQHVRELKQEFGSKLIDYHTNMGFMTVELTDEEYIKYSTDHRIYCIEKQTARPRTNFISYDIEQNNQWHLKQVSNRLFNPSGLLTGFKLVLLPTTYGIPNVEEVSIHHKIALVSAMNKLVYKSKVYTYEVELVSDLNDQGDKYNTIVQCIQVPSDFPLDTDLYIGYNIETDNIELRTSNIDNFVILYLVKLKVHKDPVTLYWANAPLGVLGFYDLRLAPDTADVYQVTSQGEGVTVIIGDVHINYALPEWEGRVTLGYNPYSDIFTDAYFGSEDYGHASHGTLVCSALVGKTCGVARKAKALGVTLFDYSQGEKPDGSSLNPSNRLMSGLSWILDYVEDNRGTPIIVNLSMGSDIIETAMDSLIAAMLAANATVVISAGNENEISNHSPYSPGCLLSAASDININPTSFTSYGPKVDVFTPGEDIYGLTNGGIVSRWAGTSVSAPILSGLCAIFLSLYPDATPAEVKRAIMSTAIEAVTYNKDYTTNLFAQNPCYGYIDRDTINTSVLAEGLIYTAIPYYIGYDGEKIYGSMHELTLNSITSAVVSAGKSESIELATAMRLVR